SDRGAQVEGGQHDAGEHQEASAQQRKRVGGGGHDANRACRLPGAAGWGGGGHSSGRAGMQARGACKGAKRKKPARGRLSSSTLVGETGFEPATSTSRT